MIVRRDHVAGGAFIVAGVLILAVSGDLPFGTLASPGAGMLPMLVIGFMIAFGLILFAGARSSPPLAQIAWPDLPHAVRVIAVAVAATALYRPLGFLITITLMLFGLLFFVERRKLIVSVAVSVAIPAATFLLFEYVLKSPLEYGLLRF